MDQDTESTAPATIYGAITVGDVWRFGLLKRAEKLLIRDIDAFLVPSQFEDLLPVLVDIIEGKPDQNQ